MVVRRVKLKSGDIFYVPLGSLNDEEPLISSREEYVPVSTERVCFGQIVWISPEGRLIIALFDLSVEHQNIKNFSLEEIVAHKVFAIGNTLDVYLKRSKFPIIGNLDVDRKMPMQALVFPSMQYSNNSELKKYRVYDYKEKHIKFLSYDEAKTMQGALGFSSEGVFIKAAKYHFGLIDKYFPDSDPDEFKPREENLVWNVFPEFYHDTWIESEPELLEGKSIQLSVDKPNNEELVNNSFGSVVRNVFKKVMNDFR